MIEHIITKEKLVAQDTRTTIATFRELCKAGMPLVIEYDKRAKNYLRISPKVGTLETTDHPHGHTVFRWEEA